MPVTRSKSKTKEKTGSVNSKATPVKKGIVKGKSAKEKKAVQPSGTKSPARTEEETAYERIYRKAQENLAKRNLTMTNTAGKKAKVDSIAKKGGVSSQNSSQESVAVHLLDEDMEMMVEGVELEFPNEEEDGLIARNNNATVSNAQVQVSACGSRPLSIPDRIDASPVSQKRRCERDESPIKDNKTLSLMQEYLIKKGVINTSMSEDQLQQFLTEETIEEEQPTAADQVLEEESQGIDEEVIQSRPAAIPRKAKEKRSNKEETRERESLSSESEVTIYKQAVNQLDPNLGKQIDDLLNKSRQGLGGLDLNGKRKVSYSSDENMDTSDETVDTELGLANAGLSLISERPRHQDEARPGTSFEQAVAAAVPAPPPQRTAEENVEFLITEHEKSKARIYEVPGKVHNTVSVNVAKIDEDYQMIDAHVDEAFKKKVIGFEYIDFSKLIVKNKTVREEENQRLEIVNKNGMSYLAPVQERDGTQISSYAKWEQAFRVYSNIITGTFPHKATELLQYHHAIHTAAMSYVWENVYAYDKEFRHHIS